MNTLQQPQSQVHPANDSSDNTAVVRLDELITGRTLHFPIYDLSGRLLLAENSVLTPELKKNLKQRGIAALQVHRDDLSRVTIQPDVAAAPVQAFSFDNELTRKLDAVIDSGLISVKNKGPAVKDRAVFLGRQGYDDGQRQRLQEQHQLNSNALSDMMNESLHGQVTDSSVVATMAASYLAEMCTDVDNTLTSTIDALSSNNIAGRSIEASLLSMAIGVEMNLDENCVREIGIAGLVNDWGMIKVRAEIIDRPAQLNQIERLDIEKHPIYSLEMLQNVSSLPTVVSLIAYQAHENYNGTGYPRRRRGNAIHLFARIIHVANIYSALIADRPFRRRYSKYSAMSMLIHMAKDRTVDPEVVRALLKVLSLFPVGSYVQLSDGSVARVLRRNGDHYTKPIVSRLTDAEGNPVDAVNPDNIIDLANSEIAIVQALPTPGSDELMTD